MEGSRQQTGALRSNGRKEGFGRLTLTPKGIRGVWCPCKTIFSFPVAPGNCRVIPICVPSFNGASPRSSPFSPSTTLGAARHACHPGDHSTLLAFISRAAASLNKCREEGDFLRGLLMLPQACSCTHSSGAQRAGPSKVFLYLESVQGCPEQSAQGPRGKATHRPYGPSALGTGGRGVMTPSE